MTSLPLRNPAWRSSVRPPSTSYWNLPLPFLRPRADHPENKPKIRSLAEKRAAKAQLARRRKAEKQEQERLRVTSQPHAIEGYRLGPGVVKRESDLHRAIVDRHEVWKIGEDPLDPRMTTPSLTDGFEHPEAAIAVDAPSSMRFGLAKIEPEAPVASSSSSSDAGVDAVRRFIDLRNASADQIHKESTRRIIEAFGRHEQDTSSTEVVIALLTYRLFRTWRFLQENPKSLPERMQLRSLHARRRKLLRGLQLHSPTRFQSILERCGIDERAAVARVVFVRTLKHTRRRRKLASIPSQQRSF